MRDQTMTFNELIEMLKTANFFDGETTDLTVEEIVHMVEKYYEPSNTLRAKLSKENFEAYLESNPDVLPKQEEPVQQEEVAEGEE
jgi:hypothetical protein